MSSYSKILITGGAGFIGSNLIRYLAAKSCNIVCIDNLSTGKLENVPDLPNIAFIEADICELTNYNVDVDCIFHLASPASPRYYLAHSFETMKVASQGTWNILEIARKANARFIFTSTSETYGDSDLFPQSEFHPGRLMTNDNRSVYSEAKRFAETLVFEYHRKFDIDTVVLRLFNAFGPGLNAADGRVIPNFVKQAMQGNPLSINGTGQQTRSFCYIDDLIDAMIKISEIDYPGPINIGNPKEISILELGRKIYEMVSPDKIPAFEYQPICPGDPMRRRPDIKLLSSLTGWRPKVSLTQGLQRYIDWFIGQVD